MNIQSPTGDINFTLTIVGFVDDTTTITASPPGSSLSELLEKTKHDAQLWNDILFTSGGRLELSKCGYHTVFYDFLHSGLPVLRHSTNQNLMLQDITGHIIPVKPKNIFQPQKNLGQFKSAAGTNQTQTAQLISKAQHIS